MKVNELTSRDLMVGDWLMFNDKPCQVKGLHNDDTVTLTGYRSMYYLIDAEPIPLTPEILEKNGLAKDPYGCHFEEDEYMELEISAKEEGIYWTINYNEYAILKLKYVHQLQHALRLCGINKEIVV